MILIENKMYRLGIDCPYGYYLISSKKTSEDATISFYEEYPAKERSAWHNLYFGCIKVDHYKALLIEGGTAFYYGHEPFDLYTAINNVALSSKNYHSRGFIVLNNDVCTIKAHFRDDNQYFYSGNYAVAVLQQSIFSINNRFFLRVCLSAKTYCRHYKFGEVGIRYDPWGKVYTYEQEFTYGQDRLTSIELNDCNFSVAMKEIKHIKLPTEDVFIIGLPLEIQPEKLQIAWIEFITQEQAYVETNNRLYPSSDDAISEDYNKLASVLELYNHEYSLNFDIAAEIENLRDIPDYVKKCALFLEAEYEILQNIKKKKQDPSIFCSFCVKATHNKRYYCAAKLAENANHVSSNETGTEYYISFDSSQTEDILLMYYNLGGDTAIDIDGMEMAKKILNESCVPFRLEHDIREFNFALTYVNPLISKIAINIWQDFNINEKLKLIYSEMLQERRVLTKWSSEYTLFAFVQDLVPDAIFQYHVDWLRQQSFDIFLPTNNVAIEYQGKQHYEPVAIFGGQDAFVRNKERDARKRKLSSQHGITVLDWKYDTPVTEKNVRTFLRSNGVNFVISPSEKKPVESSTLEMAPIRKVEQANCKEKNGVQPYSQLSKQ